MYMKFIMK